MNDDYRASSDTRFKQPEDALAVERERHAAILRLIEEGIIATDVEGKVVLINKTAETLTGWSGEEAVGKALSEFFHTINEKTRKPCEDFVERVLKTGGLSGVAHREVLIARDGTKRIIINTGVPTYDRDSNITGVVLAFRDITEKEKMEKDLLRIQKLESIGILASGIAHDFNNLLTAIFGNISLAKMYMEQGDRAFERLTEAERASMQAKGLTEQLLAFARGGAPVLKDVAIQQLLKDSVGFVLRGSNVTHELTVPDDLWPVEIDVGQISQVIGNLVINGAQAMPEGGTVKVNAENLFLDTENGLPMQPGTYVKISIADQGIGISWEHLQKVFDPYFTTKQEGHGLGLAISNFIIKAHGGHISVESQMGVGTTFFIYLPASPEKTITKDVAEKRLITGHGRILLMDDEEIVRELVCEMLKNIGYDVTVAKDGAEVVELYKTAQETSQTFDAIITDLTVPGGMGGKEAVRKLTEIDPGAKVIISSGYSSDPVMADFRKYGFSGAIAKPYRIKELSEVLHEVMNGATLYAGGA